MVGIYNNTETIATSINLLVHLLFVFFVNEGVVSAVQQSAEVTLDWQGELADALNYQVESLSINRSRRLDGEGLFQGLSLCKKKSDPKHYL